MAKILLFSDLHIYPFKGYSTILPNGMNSRLQDLSDVLDQVYDVAIKYRVSAALMGGDLHHIRKTIPVVAHNLAYDKLKKFQEADIPLLLLVGNHDQADKLGSVNSVHSLNKIARVASTSGWITLDSKNEPINVLCVPYIDSREEIRDIINDKTQTNKTSWRAGSKLLLGHFGIQGAQLGNTDFVYQNPNDCVLGDLQSEKFDAVFLGHYHKYQMLGKPQQNTFYIGSPIQHTWSDQGQDKGCLIYDTITKTHEFIPLKSPKFVKINSSMQDQWQLKYKNDFVRLESTEEWSEDRRESFRQEVGSTSFEVVKPDSNHIEDVMRKEAIAPTIGFAEMLERYIKSGIVDKSGLDEQYLINLGKEILEEVLDG